MLTSLLLIVGGLLMIRILSKRNKDAIVQETDTVVDDFLRALRNYVADGKLDYSPDQDTIRIDGGERGTLFLGNMRNQVSEIGREAQRQKISDFVRLGVAGEDPDPETIRAGLTLRPRTAEELSLRTLSMGDKFTPVIRPAGDLFLDMMCDLDVVMRGVTPDLLEFAGLDIDAAFNLATENLRTITPTGVEDLWEELEPGIWAMRIVDDYSAARLIALWPELPLPISNVGTFHMPTQGTVLLIEGTDTERQDRLLKLGEDLSNVQRPLSMRLYGPSKDGLTALHKGQAAALANAIADFRAYDDQVDMLDRMFDDTGEDVFVPKPMVIDVDETHGGLPRIGCVLIDEGTLLPEVDVIMIPENNEMMEVDWIDAARLLGAERLKPYPGLLPVRYDLRDPIPADVMIAIKAAARPLRKETPS